jgi:hypothetical protein
MMVAAPYTLLALFGFLIYRKLKRIERADLGSPGSIASDANDGPASIPHSPAG